MGPTLFIPMYATQFDLYGGVLMASSTWFIHSNSNRGATESVFDSVFIRFLISCYMGRYYATIIATTLCMLWVKKAAQYKVYVVSRSFAKIWCLCMWGVQKWGMVGPRWLRDGKTTKTYVRAPLLLLDVCKCYLLLFFPTLLCYFFAVPFFFLFNFL